MGVSRRELPERSTEQQLPELDRQLDLDIEIMLSRTENDLKKRDYLDNEKKRTSGFMPERLRTIIHNADFSDLQEKYRRLAETYQDQYRNTIEEYRKKLRKTLGEEDPF